VLDGWRLLDDLALVTGLPRITAHSAIGRLERAELVTREAGTHGTLRALVTVVDGGW
jgi:DNA-binding MarR family transcriptional regulator